MHIIYLLSFSFVETLTLGLENCGRYLSHVPFTTQKPYSNNFFARFLLPQPVFEEILSVIFL